MAVRCMRVFGRQGEDQEGNRWAGWAARGEGEVKGEVGRGRWGSERWRPRLRREMGRMLRGAREHLMALDQMM